MSRSGLGIIIVSFNSSDVLLDCLESLVTSAAPDLRIVVVDNASDDNTVASLRNWARGRVGYDLPEDCPFPLQKAPKPVSLSEIGPGGTPAPRGVTLLQAGVNLGYAGGVNLGLEALARLPEIGHFWILNPDSMVPLASLQRLRGWLAQGYDYGLLGGRVIYLEDPGKIQIDGGLVNFNTGVTGNANLGQPVATAPPEAASLDFITGASMVASRAFYDQVGPMAEDYFLYYEEVDWAMRRGKLPLAYCPGFEVYHRAGTSIGSPTMARLASPFSLYFKHRNRMRFQRRFAPSRLPLGYAYSLAKIGQMALGRHWREAGAVFRAVHGLPPPSPVRERLSPEAAKIAFGR